MLSNAPSEDPRGKAGEGLCKLFLLHCGGSLPAGLGNHGGMQMLSLRMLSGLPDHSGQAHPHCLRCGSDFSSCFSFSITTNK